MRSIRNKLFLLLPSSCNWFNGPFGKKNTNSKKYKKADKTNNNPELFMSI